MDDKQIVALFFERSESAIEELAQKYGRLCYHVAKGILASHEEAEECVNDTYLKVWESIPPTRPVQLSAFVTRITRNLSLDRIDQLTSEKRKALPLVIDELAEAIPEVSGDLTDTLALKSALNGFLRMLDVTARKVFLGRYYYCLSVQELSHRYSLGKSHVKVLLHRARLQLKEHLEKEGIVL